MATSDAHDLGPLLERSLAGNAAARNDLLARLRAYLKAQVCSWLGADLARRLDESSLAQESLLRIERAWDGFRGRSVPELLGWAKRIAYHVTLKRKAGLVDGAVADDDQLQAVPDGGRPPLETLVNEEDAVRLAAALERLPGPRRVVIQARLIDGLPFAEIARQAGTTSGALRVLFRRAVEQLRQALEDEP
jgi:RNA polymerase sigma-70 factor (ECF subfamily)